MKTLHQMAPAEVNDLSEKELRTLNCLPYKLFGREKRVFLFSKEDYWNIPDGTLCTDIFGKTFLFRKGFADSDDRDGYLEYGILK